MQCFSNCKGAWQLLWKLPTCKELKQRVFNKKKWSKEPDKSFTKFKAVTRFKVMILLCGVQMGEMGLMRDNSRNIGYV